MYFGTQYINQESSLLEQDFNPNYEQDFYNEFYKIYWLTEGELDLYIKLDTLLEGEYDLDVVRKAPWEPEEKGPTLLDRLKQMAQAILKWIKEACIRLAKAFQDALEKVKNNTLRDQAMQKLFKNYKYEDLEKAREKGWKGIPQTMIMPAKFDITESEILEKYNKFYRDCDLHYDIRSGQFTGGDRKEDELISNLDDMYKNQTVENAKACYDKIMEILKERKKNLSIKYTGWWDGEVYGKGYRVEPIEKDNNKYYYPRKEKFAICQDIVFNSQKQVVQIKKSFDNSINNLLKDIMNKDKSELNKIKHEVDTSDNQGNTIWAYYLKAKLAIESFRLELSRNILREAIKTINDTFTRALRIYGYIVSSTKSYLLVTDIKDKVTGKKVEPQAASYIDYGAEFVLESGIF